MQTPEEFAWTLYEAMDFHDHSWRDPDATARLIRARDAEVRADERGRCSVVHATLTDEALVAELVRRGVLREVRVRVVTSDFTVPDRGGPRILRRRYVSEWEQNEEDA